MPGLMHGMSAPRVVEPRASLAHPHAACEVGHVVPVTNNRRKFVERRLRRPNDAPLPGLIIGLKSPRRGGAKFAPEACYKRINRLRGARTKMPDAQNRGPARQLRSTVSRLRSPQYDESCRSRRPWGGVRIRPDHTYTSVGVERRGVGRSSDWMRKGLALSDG